MSYNDKGGRSGLGKRSADKWEETGEQNLLHSHPEYDKESVRDLSTKEFKQACDPWDEPTWKPGKLPHTGDSATRYAPKKPGPMKNSDLDDGYEPTGKYAKPGGRGQRSGS
jgi:hypothetical protein